MKKQITKPDGTVEVVEGTAEELAEYERKLQEGGNAKKPGGKKKVLLNEEELRALISEEIKKMPSTHFHFCGCQCHQQPAVLPSPIWIQPQPYIEPYQPQPGLPWYTITSQNADQIILPGNDVDGNIKLDPGREPATSGFVQVHPDPGAVYLSSN